MLIGHFAPAFVAKRWLPDVPLWVLFVAAQAVDFAYPVLVLVGVEGALLRPEAPVRFMAVDAVFSHSLVATVVMGLAVAIVARALGRSRAGIGVAVVAMSHWLGDLLVHAPDLPLTFDPGTAVGLGLWEHRALAFGLEVALVVGAAAWWGRTIDEGPRRRLAWLVAILVGVQVLADWVVPLPGTETQLALSILVLQAALAFAAWRNRL